MNQSSDGISIPSHVYFTEVEDGYVVADLRAGEYFSLDEIASVIWEILADGGSPEEAAERLIHKFVVERNRALADVDAFIDQLAEAGLVERHEPPPSSA